MTNDIQKFRFDLSDTLNYEVRVVGTPEDPWFVAKDVCDALGIRVDGALAGLDEDEKGTTTVGTLGGPQKMSIINESGLYSLILRSRKDSAKKFKKWVTSVVLPSIRKYNQGELTSDQLLALVSAKLEKAKPVIEGAEATKRAKGTLRLWDFRYRIAEITGLANATHMYNELSSLGVVVGKGMKRKPGIRWNDVLDVNKQRVVGADGKVNYYPVGTIEILDGKEAEFFSRLQQTVDSSKF